MSIASNYDPNMNLVGRINVVYKPGSTYPTPTQTNRMLFLTLRNLVATRPQWKFNIVDVSTYNGERVAREVDIYHSDGESPDELMGNVSVMWHCKEAKLFITNERIAKGRSRGRHYRTTNPEKAELVIRKYFYPSSRDELLGKAVDEAITFVAGEEGNKASYMHSARRSVFDSGSGVEFVFKHIDMYLQEYSHKRPEYEKFLEKDAVHKVVASIDTAVKLKRAFVVMLRGRNYVVKDLALGHGDVQMHTDETLPYHLRKCIGMLKLVEKGQMVSDIGCRVDEVVMVVMKDQGEQE
jgi:hypothetical protein